jgi:hypothetical protein
MAVTGHDFERHVAVVLRKNGYHVRVTPGSGDYGVDLILNKHIAVQVKFYGTPITLTAVQEVVAGKAVYNCDEAWVITNSVFTPTAKKLAEFNKVRLMDGHELRWITINPDPAGDHDERYKQFRKNPPGLKKRRREAREALLRLEETASVQWTQTRRIEYELESRRFWEGQFGLLWREARKEYKELRRSWPTHDPVWVLDQVKID